MQSLHWALTAAALLLFLIAILNLFSGLRSKDGQGKQGMGCGFALLAALLWSYVLGQYFGDWKDGLRVSVGVLLVLPAVAAVARPGKASLCGSVLGLILGVVLAGPVVQRWWQQEYGERDKKLAIEVEERIDSLKALRMQIGAELQRLRVDEQNMALELEARDYGSFEEMTADEAAVSQLEEWGRVRELIVDGQDRLDALDSRIPALETQLQLLRRETETREGFGDELSGEELDGLREELLDEGDLKAPGIGEDYEREVRLRELFDKL